MGKKSKKKKNQFKDFQKVKLKVGKKLPKGQNETLATFKSRSIQIKEQLKGDSENQPTTKRKLSIADLLSQCQHYNVTVRQDAVSGIRDLLKAHPHLLHKHLPAILGRCSELFLDNSEAVRSCVHKVLQLVFCNVTATDMAPFFPAVSAHLCCAMTHIQDDIQRDSLAILDLCLDYFPGLVVAGSNQIMSNFIEQISRQTETSKGGSKGRSLLINPSSRLSGQKWRNRVLERLHKFFKTYLNQHYMSDASTVESVQEVMYSEQSYNVQPLLCCNQEAASWFSLRSISQKENDRIKELQHFIEVLVPLLLDCWIEASPTELNTDLSGNALNRETVSTLWNVITVLVLLLEVTEKQTSNTYSLGNFSDKYLKDIGCYFMPYFPYSMHEGRKAGKKGLSGPKMKPEKNEHSNISVLTLNMCVCKVLSFMLFSPSCSQSVLSASEWRDQVLGYLQGSVSRSKLNQEQLTITIDIVEKIIAYTEDEDIIASLLELVYGCYKSRCQTLSAETKILLKFFGRFAFEKNLTLFKRYPVLSTWIVSLPSILWQFIQNCGEGCDEELASQILHYMKCAGALAPGSFVENLSQLLFDHIFCSEDDIIRQLPQHLQKRLLELIFWIPQIDQAKLTVLSRYCRRYSSDKSVLNHLLEVVNVKAVHEEYTGFSTEIDCKDLSQKCIKTADYVSFILTLIVGSTDVGPPSGCSPLACNWKPEVFVDITAADCVSHQLHLMKLATDCLRQLPHTAEIAESVGTFLQKSLLRRECVSLITALGILHLISTVAKLTRKSSCETDDCYKYNATCVLRGLDAVTRMFGCVMQLRAAMEMGLFQVTSDVDMSQYHIDHNRVQHGDNSSTAARDPADQPHEAKTGTSGLVLMLQNAISDICCQCLLEVPEVFSAYVNIIANDIQGCTQAEQVMLDIVALSQVFKWKTVHSLIRRKKQCLKNLVKHLDERQIAKELWWTQFKYEVEWL